MLGYFCVLPLGLLEWQRRPALSAARRRWRAKAAGLRGLPPPPLPYPRHAARLRWPRRSGRRLPLGRPRLLALRPLALVWGRAGAGGLRGLPAPPRTACLRRLSWSGRVRLWMPRAVPRWRRTRPGRQPVWRGAAPVAKRRRMRRRSWLPRRGPRRAAGRGAWPHLRMRPSARGGALPRGRLRSQGNWRRSRPPLLPPPPRRSSVAHALNALRGGGRRPPLSPPPPRTQVRGRRFTRDGVLSPICMGRRDSRLSRGSRAAPSRGRRTTTRPLPRSRARSRRAGEGGAGPPTRRASTSAYLDPLANLLRWGRCRGPCCRGRRRCRRRHRRGSHRRCRRLPLRRCPTKLRLSRGLHPACGPVFWPGRARRRGPFRPVPAEVAGGRRACSLRWRAGRFGEPIPGGGRSLGRPLLGPLRVSSALALIRGPACCGSAVCPGLRVACSSPAAERGERRLRASWAFASGDRTPRVGSFGSTRGCTVPGASNRFCPCGFLFSSALSLGAESFAHSGL